MESEQASKKISFKKMLEISLFSFRIYIKANKSSGVLFFIFEILSKVVGMVDFLIVAKIIDVVVSILQNNTSIELVIPYLIFLVSFNFSRALINRATWYYRNKTSQYFFYYSDIFLYEYYKNLGVPVMEDPDKNNVINRGMREMSQLPNLFYTFVNVIAEIINVIISGIIIFHFMSKLLLVATVWMIIRNIPGIGFIKEMYQYGFKKTEERRMNSSIINYLLDNIYLIELSIHGATEYIKNRYLKFVETYLAGWLRIRKKMYVWGISFSFFNIFVYFWMMLNIIGKIVRDKLSVGRLYFYISMVERFERNLDGLFSEMAALYEMALKIDDTHQFFNLKPSFEDGKIILKDLKSPPEIFIDNISFKYPNTERYILKDFSLKIRPGEKIAIVGVNGAGKTTLTKLLLRFYQTTDGSIFINEDNIDDLKISSYHKNVGTLAQEFSKYGALTTEENIYLGDVSNQINTKKIKEAAKSSDADDFINVFPNKYKQVLSERYSDGIRPSTGQWQRIAISRLFYRNPWLVIFDEPTASIDAEAEYKIFNNIYNFFENKTVIIISHRFSTVRNADRIILIDGGHIVEEGSHDELIKLDGKYAKAFRLQAEGYEIK